MLLLYLSSLTLFLKSYKFKTAVLKLFYDKTLKVHILLTWYIKSFLI